MTRDRRKIEQGIFGKTKRATVVAPSFAAPSSNAAKLKIPGKPLPN
jgi:hypothetical protein